METFTVPVMNALTEELKTIKLTPGATAKHFYYDKNVDEARQLIDEARERVYGNSPDGFIDPIKTNHVLVLFYIACMLREEDLGLSLVHDFGEDRYTYLKTVIEINAVTIEEMVKTVFN